MELSKFTKIKRNVIMDKSQNIFFVSYNFIDDVEKEEFIDLFNSKYNIDISNMTFIIYNFMD